MARETHALCCEAVEVGRASDRIAIGAHDVCGVIVRYQEQEIRLPSLLDLCRRGERGRHSSQDGASRDVRVCFRLTHGGRDGPPFGRMSLLRLYFDTAYVAKCYLNEPGGNQVRRLAASASGLYSSSWCVAEMACVIHRNFREGTLDAHEADAIRNRFRDDVRNGVWSL